jgi:WD40 repeat protein
MSQSGRVDSVNYDSNGRLLITLASNNINVWSLSSSGRYTRQQILNLSVSLASARISPPSSKIAAAGGNSTAYIWRSSPGSSNNFSLWQNLTAPGSSASQSLTCVAFSSDGSTLMAGSSNGALYIWSLNTSTDLFQFAETIAAHSASVADLSARNNRFVSAGGTDGSFKVWERQTAATRYTMLQEIRVGAGLAARAVALGLDQNNIGAGISNGSVIIYTNNLVANSYTMNQQLDANPGGVYSVSFSSDSSKLATTGQDSTTAYWTRPSK